MTCHYASTCLASRLPSDNICATCEIRGALGKRDFVTVKTTVCYNCHEYSHCLATRVGQCERTKAVEVTP